MTDLLLQFGVSNLLISLAIAIVAWAVHTTGKRPLVAHLLWLIVLAKLITPPILAVPVVPAVPGLTATGAEPLPGLSGIEVTSTNKLALNPDAANGTLDRSADDTGSSIAGSSLVASSVTYGKIGLILIWVLGSACVLAWSLVRIVRFNRLLGMASEAAPPELQRVASELAQRLGLRSTPTIHITSAHVSPMVWWIGGRVRILIPAALPREMDAGQLRWILAHELAHVRRRDHLVRWLEWLACVGFWWNPVAWWARRNLRINEEICCDALVLASLEPKPRTYASALMTVVEFLASPAIRPPAVASEMNSGGFLERRFSMIVSSTPMPGTQRWLRASILLCAAGLLPLGMATVDAAPPERTADERVVDKTDGPQLVDVLTQLVADGTMDPEVAFTLYVASQEAKKNELVAAGKITPEAFERRLAMGMKYKVAEAKMERAVAEGELKPEDVERRLIGMRKAMAHEAERIEKYERAEAELRTLVAEGKLTEEEAKKRLAGMRKTMDDKPKRRSITREDYAAAEAKMRQMVAEGKMTPEDLEKRLIEMRKAMAAQARRGDGKIDWEAIKRRIEGAVERGEMTREEADARYEALKARSKARDVDIDAIVRRIEAAVESGEMTREEADEKLEGLRRRMAERARAGEGRADDEGDGLEGHYARLGIDREGYGRIMRLLSENGVEREQLEGVMGGMLRVIHEVRSEGDAFELDERMAAYFTELGLTDEQIELVVGIAQRIVRGMGDSDPDGEGGRDRGR